MFKKFFDVLKSTISMNGKPSSVRVSSYILLITIAIFAYSLLAVELTAAIVAFCTTGKYLISNEIIILFGSLCTHHLTILGINKNAETKQKGLDSKQNSNPQKEEVKKEEVKPEGE